MMIIHTDVVSYYLTILDTTDTPIYSIHKKKSRISDFMDMRKCYRCAPLPRYNETPAASVYICKYTKGGELSGGRIGRLLVVSNHLYLHRYILYVASGR